MISNRMARQLGSQQAVFHSGREDPWDYLSIFESHELVRELYQRRHGRAKSEKAFEIASHVAQARQYFDAASQSGELTKPLLQYYGVLALTRALILFANPKVRESALSQGHGLKAIGWETRLANGPECFLDALIGTQSGTFTDLLLATKNQEKSLVNLSSGSGEEYSLIQLGDSENAPELLRVGDILSRMTDLRNTVLRAANEKINSFPVLLELFRPNFGAWLNVFVDGDGRPSETDLRAWYGLPEQTYFHTDGVHSLAGEFPVLRFWMPEPPLIPPTDRIWIAEKELPPIRSDAAGMTYLIAPLENGFIPSSLCSMFLASYAAGMLVRYFPSTWRRVSAGRGDALLPILRRLNEVVATRFPLLALQILED